MGNGINPLKVSQAARELAWGRIPRNSIAGRDRSGFFAGHYDDCDTAQDIAKIADYPVHLGDPLALVIADCIEQIDMEIVVNAVMAGGERWEMAEYIAKAVRQHLQDQPA